jgi:hypothetical protein
MTHLATFSLSALLCCMSLGASAEAADLTGAWTTNADYCGKVYVKTGDKVSFTKDAVLEGGGFIIDANEIRGPSGICRIKASKEEGAVTHLVAACASDIMISENHFSLKTLDANTIVRIYPSMPELDTRYYRCPM